LTEYEMRLKNQRNRLILWWVILGMAVLIKAVILFLKIKFRIEIPYVLNIIL
jgi:hypothetical protein